MACVTGKENKIRLILLDFLKSKDDLMDVRLEEFEKLVDSLSKIMKSEEANQPNPAVDEPDFGNPDINIEACRREGKTLKEIGDLLNNSYIRKKIRGVAALTDLNRFDKRKFNEIVEEVIHDKPEGDGHVLVTLLYFKDLITRSWMEKKPEVCWKIFSSTAKYIAEKTSLVRWFSLFVFVITTGLLICHVCLTWFLGILKELFPDKNVSTFVSLALVDRCPAARLCKV